MVRWCWVNFQCRGVLLIWYRVGQGPTVLAVGAGGGCLDIFSLIFHFSFPSPSLWETARYRLKYCLKGPLSPNQPTNQPSPLVLPWFLRHLVVRFAWKISILSINIKFPSRNINNNLFYVVVLFHLSAIADKIYRNYCAPWSVDILIKYTFP